MWVVMTIKINEKKEVKLKCQENAKNDFLKEMVMLRLKRMIPKILLYFMTMLTKLIFILTVTLSV